MWSIKVLGVLSVMAIVIKTEAGFLAKGVSEYTWYFANARRFSSVREALGVRGLLNVHHATVLRTAPRRYRLREGVDVFPDESEEW